MKMWILFSDELKGFYKSRMMLVLWIGIPLVVLLFRALQPNTGPEFSFTEMSALLVSSLAGTLGSILLTVKVINEHTGRIYDLFLIRPIKRYQLLLANFLAVYGCIVIAALVAETTGIILDLAVHGAIPSEAISRAIDSLIVSMAGTAVACAGGLLMGVVCNSVLVGVVLVIFGTSNLTSLPYLPMMLRWDVDPTWFAGLISAALTFILVVLSIIAFNRKDL